MKLKGSKDMTLTRRRELETLLKAGLHKKAIAKQLGVCLATVYNELQRGKCTQKVHTSTDCYGDRHYKTVTIYSADKANDLYLMNQTTHGAPLKIGNDFEFVKYIEDRVVNGKISPCAALGESKRRGVFRTSISKSTLYRYIHSQTIFTKLKMEHVKIRKKHYAKTTVKRAPRGTSIEKRPEEILKRAEFGHWEMDCVVGKKYSRHTLLTFTERMTRYEIIIKMPNRKQETVVKSLNRLERRFGNKFRKVFKTITVDNGSEFSDFVGLEKSIYKGRRTSVYYCHPYTSCERGSNERLNREIRRIFPKGTDFTKVSEERVKACEDWVNAYPREIFGYATSAERFAEQLKAI